MSGIRTKIVGSEALVFRQCLNGRQRITDLGPVPIHYTVEFFERPGLEITKKRSGDVGNESYESASTFCLLK